jgi:hypothetical protein
MNTELALIDDWYELTRYLAERVATFPRAHRYTLGATIAGQCDALLADLVRARYMPRGAAKLDLLRAVNVELEVLRFRLRLAHDLKALAHNAHGHALERLQGCGRQLGGWVRSLEPKAEPK